MSVEGTKERVTLVPSKSKLPTYFRFGEALAASCGLSPTYGHATTWEKTRDCRTTSSDVEKRWQNCC